MKQMRVVLATVICLVVVAVFIVLTVGGMNSTATPGGMNNTAFSRARGASGTAVSTSQADAEKYVDTWRTDGGTLVLNHDGSGVIGSGYGGHDVKWQLTSDGISLADASGREKETVTARLSDDGDSLLTRGPHGEPGAIYIRQK